MAPRWPAGRAACPPCAAAAAVALLRRARALPLHADRPQLVQLSVRAGSATPRARSRARPPRAVSSARAPLLGAGTPSALCTAREPRQAPSLSLAAVAGRGSELRWLRRARGVACLAAAQTFALLSFGSAPASSR
eukprot:6691729-Prymnesium_polylepis.1